MNLSSIFISFSIHQTHVVKMRSIITGVTLFIISHFATNCIPVNMYLYRDVFSIRQNISTSLYNIKIHRIESSELYLFYFFFFCQILFFL